MRILHIARNIPVPGILENKIILRIIKSISEASDIRSTVWFPTEFMPRILARSDREKAISRLPRDFQSEELAIRKLRYVRLPGTEYAYQLTKSFWWMNGWLSKQEVRNDFDLIHAYNVMPDGAFALDLQKRIGIPYILTIRNGDVNKLNKLAPHSSIWRKYEEVIQSAREVIVHNHSTAELAKSLGRCAIKIPHGIEGRLIPSTLPVKEKTIIAVGNLLPIKRFDWLVDAFKNTRIEGWQLKVIGDGPLRSALTDLAGIDAHIHLLGHQSRETVLEELAKASIFVMPSVTETFGLAYLEAAAAGCCVVGTEKTGIYGWLEAEKEACYISDRESLKKVLLRLQESPDLVASVGKNARQKVLNTMIWDQQIKKYQSIYEATYEGWTA